MKLCQTTYVILGVLSFHPRQSGYHIRKTIEGSVGYFWNESFGQIYPTLKKLLADGLIMEDGPRGPKGSQEYSITEAGKNALAEWLELPSRNAPPRNEFLLKLFFGMHAPPQVSLKHLEDFRRKIQEMLNQLLELEKLAAEYSQHQPGSFYAMLTLDFGLAQLRSAMAWSEMAIDKISKLSEPAQKAEVEA